MSTPCGPVSLLAQFVHPGLAVAAIGLAAVPILIHLWNRRRHRPVIWAAMSFLLAAHKRSTRRLRIEQFVLLAIRCLILALFCLGLARPFYKSAAAFSVGRAQRHHLVIIDNSYSTRAAGPEGARVLADIGAAAERLIARLPMTDAVSLISAAKPARVLEVESIDRQRTLESLSTIGATYRRDDLAGAIRLAARLAAESRTAAGRSNAYLMTDATRAAWAGRTDENETAPLVAALRELNRHAHIDIVRLAAGDRENVAVTDLSLTSRLVTPGLPCSVRAEVANFGREAAGGLRLRLLHEGQLVREVSVPKLGPGVRRSFELQLRLDQIGEHLLHAAVSADGKDALADDDRRLLAVAVTDTARVLLVDGRPGTERFAGQAGYLATALSAGAESGEGGPIAVRIVSAADLPAEPIGDYGMVALCNVRELPEAIWGRLHKAVSDGAALVVFLGDAVSPEQYNRDAADLMPVRLAGVVGQAANEEAYVRLSTSDLTHPLVAGFAAEPDCSLFTARIHRYCRVESDPALRGVRQIVAYENGDPALVERVVGRGVVILCTTTANMDWTNLPAKGDYVSLVWDLLAYAWPGPRGEHNVLVGEAAVQPLTARQSGLSATMAAPDGTRQTAEVRATSGEFVAVFDDPDVPGEYRLSVGPDSYRFAVNIDPIESDLTPLTEEALRRLVDADCGYWSDVEAMIERRLRSPVQELGWIMLYAVFALLLLETFLSMKFGHHE